MSIHNPFCPPFTPMVDVLPETQVGDFAVEHFTVNRGDVTLNMFHQQPRLWEGRYARLMGPKGLLMSDTGYERLTNFSFVSKAHGHVLIGGLGLGMILLPILNRLEVLSVRVVELESGVIELVEPLLRNHLSKRANRKLKIYKGDIRTYEPIEGLDETYHTVYFDIWPEVRDRYYGEIKYLRRRWGQFLRGTKAWIEAWERKEMRNLAR